MTRIAASDVGSRWRKFAVVAAFAAMWLMVIPGPQPATQADDSRNKAKSSKKGKGPPPKQDTAATRQLDQKNNDLVQKFLNDAESIATEYVKLGEFDRARDTMSAAMKLRPEDKSLQEKMKWLEDQLVSSNDYEVELNAQSGWESSRAMVTAGKPVRIVAAGTYKFNVSGVVTAAGFPSKDNKTDMLGAFPAGALVGIVLKADKELSEPFLIGESRDIRPPDSGMLFLRINAPQDNKNNGKIKVTISGSVTAP
jgi:hypothetical protein